MSQWGEDDDTVDELPAAPRKSIPDADRELLEHAARALGATRVEDVDGEQWLILHFADGTETHGWNPLLFYSDTFELAVSLEIMVMPRNAKVFNGVAEGFQAVECEAEDVFTATCRAVVRAAAEIGKQRA